MTVPNEGKYEGAIRGGNSIQRRPARAESGRGKRQGRGNAEGGNGELHLVSVLLIQEQIVRVQRTVIRMLSRNNTREAGRDESCPAISRFGSTGTGLKLDWVALVENVLCSTAYIT